LELHLAYINDVNIYNKKTKNHISLKKKTHLNASLLVTVSTVGQLEKMQQQKRCYHKSKALSAQG
jgi:hypothetical protein